MNCEEAIRLMDAYLDAELDPITSQSIEQHLRDCPRCQQAYEAQRSLCRAIQSVAPYYQASPELRQRIQSSLREELDGRDTSIAIHGSQALPQPKPSQPRSIASATPWNWLALAAAVVLSAIVVWNLAPRSNGTADNFLATQLIASHVRSLMANHLTDIVSSDQHTVKPWLDEKLDFAAPVVDLASQGFPLLGGRLDYLDNRPVAALVYQRRKHFINVFIWLAQPGTTGAEKTISRQGYHLLHWADADFNYWAVSDVNANDLQTFKQLFEKQLPPRG